MIPMWIKGLDNANFGKLEYWKFRNLELADAPAVTKVLLRKRCQGYNSGHSVYPCVYDVSLVYYVSLRFGIVLARLHFLPRLPWENESSCPSTNLRLLLSLCILSTLQHLCALPVFIITFF